MEYTIHEYIYTINTPMVHGPSQWFHPLFTMPELGLFDYRCDTCNNALLKWPTKSHILI